MYLDGTVHCFYFSGNKGLGSYGYVTNTEKVASCVGRRLMGLGKYIEKSGWDEVKLENTGTKRKERGIGEV